MVISRRTLMVSGAALAAALAVGVEVVDLPDAAVGARVLSAGEMSLVEAVGEALFPPGNIMGVSTADVALGPAVDELIGEYMDPVTVPVLRYLLRALDVGTLASRGSGFRALSLADRRSVLENWSDNAVLPRRLAYDTFKTLLGMAFFNAPVARTALGWDAGGCHLGAS